MKYLPLDVLANHNQPISIWFAFNWVFAVCVIGIIEVGGFNEKIFNLNSGLTYLLSISLINIKINEINRSGLNIKNNLNPRYVHMPILCQ